jgi:hypothetical protein
MRPYNRVSAELARGESAGRRQVQGVYTLTNSFPQVEAAPCGVCRVERWQVSDVDPGDGSLLRSWDESASIVVEVYPSLWTRRFPKEHRNGDEQAAYCVAAWLPPVNPDGHEPSSTNCGDDDETFLHHDELRAAGEQVRRSTCDHITVFLRNWRGENACYDWEEKRARSSSG